MFGLFGPSKEEIWRQVADEIGGEVTEGSFLGGRSKLEVAHGEWTITLDTYSQSTSTGKTQTVSHRQRSARINTSSNQSV